MFTKDNIKALKDYFSAQNDVLAVYLYGSYARGTYNPLSDIDIAIITEPTAENISARHLDFIDKVSGIFESDNVDVQLLTAKTPLPLAISMLKGQLIYCRSQQRKAAIEAQLLSQYQDFYPFLNLQIKEMEKRLERGTYAGRY